ncbi:Aste57867_14733 [Aphanomyces stellatus]|uniref:Aste57867_14733 protein n=1 Tax=Aphanomyces stellatus TaxID=120398 RepID=A0A485L1F9_9STRA|nr:hypothetical protein As57867_014678 [Aphanomyces stellatus]VFT91551.1 Aste57867_14733 [Aphanomyces stellatus]
MAPLADVLRPACDGLVPGIKLTKPVNFATEKKLFAAVALPILEAMSAARTKLLCECRDFKKPAQNQWEETKTSFQMETYLQAATDYLSLVKGFTEHHAPPPPTTTTTTDANDEQTSLLASDESCEQPPPSIPFTCCEWLDLTSTTSVHSLNAHHEYAHALLAVGCVCFHRASDLTQVMLQSRDFEYDEPKLKEAYNLLLRVAGLFEALLAWLGIPSSSSSTAAMSDAAMQQWRLEQSNAANPEVQTLQRVKDFEQGTLVRFLHGVGLAQAQELVVLRGVTRENVDYVLMGKLCMDISKRYAELTPTPKFTAWAAWKATYYAGLSAYYHGVFEWNKNEGAACAQAIAQFQAAKDLWAKLDNNHVQRSKAIVQRDLDIATSRNQSIYHELVPDTITPLDRVGLVQSQSFPIVASNALWKETPQPIATVKQGLSNAPAAAPPVHQVETSSGGCACAIL